jgi:hypothetical protein
MAVAQLQMPLLFLRGVKHQRDPHCLALASGGEMAASSGITD